MLKEKLGLDAKDATILSLYTKQPDISQAELARLLKISQPSVNARISKLKAKGILASTHGIEFNKTSLYLLRVDFTAPNAQQVLDTMKHCSFFVNGFIMSGKTNTSIFIVGHSLEKIETIINEHLRTKPDIKDITTSIIVSAAKPFICSIDIEKEEHEGCKNKGSCKVCPMHTAK